MPECDFVSSPPSEGAETVMAGTFSPGKFLSERGHQSRQFSVVLQSPHLLEYSPMTFPTFSAKNASFSFKVSVDHDIVHLL